ncbi:MAG: hypothetical protein ACRDQ5_21620 [Sciscionella sp.]
MRKVEGIDKQPVHPAEIQLFADLGRRPVASVAEHQYHRIERSHG